ncbi:NADP-dependent oxidoreductase [Streptomyces fuscigenes]|uniref:NADP-dependent oxidoreductase n=1 Tax=Streptomyces fuscigenes TaxID=1528880 RepID=UPI001F29EF26|nr:NADP-dependent oxidoreductase [Streptomyces fuscigenes]MCF3962504.1 NADP-dependent oxidoreductase [Streptomyces fuscigenes]
METMRAVRAHERGGPEKLRPETARRPEPGPGEILVAVVAASVTAGELTWPASWTDSADGSGRDRTPVIPSHEVSGTVAALGPGVREWAVGDEVYALIPFTRDGAAADYVTLPADVAAAKPAGIGHTAAAALPLAGLTALQALESHAGLRAGAHVLVQGAAGGVGSLAVQIAVAKGATVTATASAAGAHYVASLGAGRVLDHRTSRFEDEVSGVDIVLDCVGGDTQTRSWSVLRPGGVLVSVAEPTDARLAERAGARGDFFIVEPDRTGLDALTALVDDGRLAPRIDRVVPLADTPAAYEALEREHPQGKIVISVAEETPRADEV